jgi:DNA-binding transcriptional LysR family regulator
MGATLTPTGPAALRLADLSTFLAIVRCGSLSGAARNLGVSPSQVSKAMARLERQLGLTLLARSSLGATPSETGRRIAPDFEAILQRLQNLQHDGTQAAPELTVVATAFLNQHCLPAIARRLPALRIRSLEVPPGIASAYAGLNAFDAAITTSTERWPGSWERVKVGELRRALFASPQLAKKLGGGPLDPEKLRGIPFVAPIYSHNGQVITGDDLCPLPLAARRLGHETQTVALALELAQATQQLVFAPVISARAWVKQGRLVELPVRGWDVRDPLFLGCHGERVQARVQRELIATLREALAE